MRKRALIAPKDKNLARKNSSVSHNPLAGWVITQLFPSNLFHMIGSVLCTLVLCNIYLPSILVHVNIFVCFSLTLPTF